MLGLGAECLLEGGEAFFRLSIALDSKESVSWIFLSSRLSEGGEGGGAGALHSPMISLMMSLERKSVRASFINSSHVLVFAALKSSSRVLKM